MTTARAVRHLSSTDHAETWLYELDEAMEVPGRRGTTAMHVVVYVHPANEVHSGKTFVFPSDQDGHPVNWIGLPVDGDQTALFYPCHHGEAVRKAGFVVDG